MVIMLFSWLKMIKIAGLFIFLCIIVPFYMTFLKFGTIEYGVYLNGMSMAGLLISGGVVAIIALNNKMGL